MLNVWLTSGDPVENPASCDEFPVSPFPTMARSPKHVLVPQEVSSQSRSMPWRLYWRLTNRSEKGSRRDADNKNDVKLRDGSHQTWLQYHVWQHLNVFALAVIIHTWHTVCLNKPSHHLLLRHERLPSFSFCLLLLAVLYFHTTFSIWLANYHTTSSFHFFTAPSKCLNILNNF